MLLVSFDNLRLVRVLGNRIEIQNSTNVGFQWKQLSYNLYQSSDYTSSTGFFFKWIGCAEDLYECYVTEYHYIKVPYSNHDFKVIRIKWYIIRSASFLHHNKGSLHWTFKSIEANYFFKESGHRLSSQQQSLSRGND